GGGGGGGGGGGTLPPPTDDLPERQAFLIGMPDGTVRPNAGITRAEVATIFFRLISDDTRTASWSQSNPFDDVALNQWFNNAVSTTTNMNLFQGVGDGLFAPGRGITRAELAAVLVRFAGVDTGLFTTDDDQFSDIAGHWAQAYINEAARQGWIEGAQGLGGPFLPNQPITRAETAAMVTRIFARLVYSVDDLLPDRIRFSDLTNQNAWFYLYMASATNSFTYEREAGEIYLTWVEIIEPRDWRVLERPESQPGDILQ
ncbi:MAG: S-layer homology domain-containing protein, partial [Oscillospiraceae bacterium]|nr:S-layer homology domain-containing protein [Oscillospiraceae bacterium]